MEEFQKHPISIRFLLYGYGKDKRDTYPIYASVILNRKNSQLSMKMFAKEEDWDFEKGRYKVDEESKEPAKNSGKKAVEKKVEKEHKKDKEHCVYGNNQLREEKNRILKAYYDVKKNIAKPELKAVVNLYRNKNVESPEMRLVSYYDNFVKEIKELPQQYSFGAVEHYRKTKKHLDKFLASKGWENIRLNELNCKFIISFEHFLLTTPNPQNGGKSMNENTSCTYLKKLKAVVNNAIRNEVLTRNPFLGYQIKRNKKITREYLTNEEIEAIKNCDLGNNKRLDEARDFFLFSVYTGLRHSDAFALKNSNIRVDRDGVKWITIIQIKTSDELAVPMLEQAVQIYDKYESLRKSTGFVLPRFINQSINRDIQIIAKKAGITKHVSHHVARHTFASTITLQRGMEIKTVSKMLGHTSLASTEIYARVSPTRLVDATKELNKKLE